MSATFDLISQKFPGKIRLSPADLSVLLGFKEQTIRNKICDGSLPIRSHLDCSRRFFNVLDVAAHLDSISAEPSAGKTEVAKAMRKNGRPSKTEEAQARELGITVRQLRNRQAQAGGAV